MSTASASEKLTPEKKLLDVRAVASRLSCSTRHVWRLADGGLLPPPVRLGSLVRWDEFAIAAWIEGGCRPVKKRGSH